MRTAQQIVDEISHGIGADPDTRLSLWTILNRAGRELTTTYPWSWRQGLAELAAVADQEYVDLPEDFARLDTIRTVGTSSFGCKVGTLEEIEDYRSTTVPYPMAIYLVYPLTYTPPGNSTVSGRYRLEVYPTPTTAGTPTFRIQYQRRWVDQSEDNPNGKPGIPDEFEAALVYLARSIALVMMDQTDSIERARYHEEIARLKVEEQERLINHGPSRGGAREHRKVPVVGFTDLDL